MGKAFSCLPINKRNSCTRKLPRKGPAIQENKSHSYNGDVRGKGSAKSERNEAEEVTIVKRVRRTVQTGKAEQNDVDDVNIKMRTSSNTVDNWKLEDIEQEGYWVKTTRNADPEAQMCCTQSDSQKHLEDNGLISSSLTDRPVTRHLSVDSGFADSKTSVSHPHQAEDRPLTPWRTRIVLQAKHSPRRGAKDPDSIPVSLRQTHADYNKRLNTQRYMTRALRDQRSPSPDKWRNPETSVNNVAISNGNSQGDTAKNETDNHKDIAESNDWTTCIGDDLHSTKVVPLSADDTNLDLPVSSVPDNALHLHETEGILNKGRLRQLENEFLKEFNTGDVELTPVPSFLKIIGEGHIPAILREENLKRLEEEFYKEFPVEYLEGDTMSCNVEERKNSIIVFEATDESESSVNGNASDIFDGDVDELNNVKCTHGTKDKSEEEIRECSSEDELSDTKGNDHDIKTDETSSDNTDDSIDDILHMANDNMNVRNLTRKERKQLISEYKKHDFTMMVENTIGENKAELRDICLNIIGMCLNQIRIDTTANHWWKNINFDDIEPEDGGRASFNDSDVDDRQVKLATLFENTIKEEREDVEEFCFSLVLQCVDACKYMKDNGKIADALTDRSIEHSALVRHIRSDTKYVIAVDENGIGHPRLAGIGYIVTMDNDGIGHSLY